MPGDRRKGAAVAGGGGRSGGQAQGRRSKPAPRGRLAPRATNLDRHATAAGARHPPGRLVAPLQRSRAAPPLGRDGAAQVLADPGTHLAAVTVMFRREDGYDPDNANWFWAKYLPDGSLDTNPAGMALAGRVAKGADQGCIACHAAEEDYLYTTDHIAE